MFALVENSNLFVSLFTMFYWGPTAGLNAVIILGDIGKQPSCLEAV